MSQPRSTPGVSQSGRVRMPPRAEETGKCRRGIAWTIFFGPTETLNQWYFLFLWAAAC